MADKPLQLINGVPTEVEGKVVSAGAGDAGRIPALGSDGRLDPSTMPAGFNADVDAAIPASENLLAGDFVNLWNDVGTLKARKADSSNDRPASHFTLTAVTAPANATLYRISELNTAVAGLTPGTVYYLGTGGAVTATVPTGAGAIVQRIGRAKAATALPFENTEYYKRA